MILQTAKKGFTLIELLVVITIIGILATWATATYTSQIQKARDSVRLTDIKALQSWVEQVYQDTSEYPYSTTFATQIVTYVPKIPSDPKHGQPCNDWGTPANAPECAYTYVTWPDDSGILFWEYEVTTAFENPWNVSTKAATDWGWTWVETTRLELGLDIANNDSSTAAANVITSVVTWACTAAWAEETNETNLIYINGNPADLSTSECN